MTASKPVKPKRRKASGVPTLTERVAALEGWSEQLTKWGNTKIRNDNGNNDVLRDCVARLDALESRDRLRDKSHDAPVSNAGEAVGLHFRIVDELPRMSWWRRFFGFMGEP